MYVSLYLLVPTSINSIFFPKSVKAYSEARYGDFKRFLKFYYLVLVGYAVLIVGATVFFLKPFVSLVFPNHLPGVHLVYLVLPGLIMQSLSEPIGLIFNSAVILRPMLIINMSNLVFNVIGIVLMIIIGVFY